VAALQRWGLLDEVVATGCAPIETYTFDFGPFVLSGRPRPGEGSSTAYAPRRTVLDRILVEAAERAGAEVRERFAVDELVVEEGVVVGLRGRDEAGALVTERARVVVGADGSRSRIARDVDAPRYAALPKLQWAFYSYWAGLPVDGMQTFIRPDRGWAAIPTNDGLTLVVVGWPYAESDAYRADVEANYLRTLDLVPDFAEQVRVAERVEPFRGGAAPNFFRRPYGPGWALVGDAGYTKDPITAQGMTDAFHDAERCAAALHEAFDGGRPFAEAMADAQRARDAHVEEIYGFTTSLATLAPPPPEVQATLAALAGDRDGMDLFAGVVAGTVPPSELMNGSPATARDLRQSA
jgi:flavin-dependent dehydrogenase